MTYNTIISLDDFKAHASNPNWVVVDTRFSLDDVNWGRHEYLKAHIPGAVYAHLDEDLCSAIIPGKTGRHPLPLVDEAVKTFSRWGIGQGVQVVVYDSWPTAGLSVSSRLWWMLRWLGHEAVAVLDGGWSGWLHAGLPLVGGQETRAAVAFAPRLRMEMFASSQEVDRLRFDPSVRVLDSRSADRFRGENETIDPVAGHIPGAISAPFAENCTPGGYFLPPAVLRQRFADLLGDTPANKAIFYCGSGVTATMNLLALAQTGLGDGRLYAGSWSEWITDPSHSVAT